MAGSSNRRFYLTKHAKSSALLVSLIIHVVLFFIGLSIFVIKVTESQEQTFVIQLVDRSQMKLEPRKPSIPVHIRKIKPPTSMIEEPIAFEQERDAIESKLSDMIWNMGNKSDQGSSGEMNGLGVNFFGVMGGGTHVVFILDLSSSMQGAKDRVMRREAARIIDDLFPETHFAVIFFGSVAWSAGLEPDWDNWVLTRGDWLSYRPKDWNNLQQVQYEKASLKAKDRMISEIKAAPMAHGTIFDCPIYMALSMDPVPNTIFFITDGDCPSERSIDSLKKMVDQLKEAGKQIPVMHTVGIGLSHSDQLEEMAALMGGECRILTAQDYMRQYGNDLSMSTRQNPRFDITKVKSVSAREYPIQFDLR